MPLGVVDADESIEDDTDVTEEVLGGHVAIVGGKPGRGEGSVKGTRTDCSLSLSLTWQHGCNLLDLHSPSTSQNVPFPLIHLLPLVPRPVAARPGLTPHGVWPGPCAPSTVHTQVNTSSTCIPGPKMRYTHEAVVKLPRSHIPRSLLHISRVLCAQSRSSFTDYAYSGSLFNVRYSSQLRLSCLPPFLLYESLPPPSILLRLSMIVMRKVMQSNEGE